MARRGLVVWLACLLVGCPNDPAEHDECGDEPDFLVTISTETGLLPPDLRVLVEYGGGHELFTFRSGVQPSVVFCSRILSSAGGAGASGSVFAAGEAGAGGTGSDAASLACQLYTEGPATIELSAAGYITLERDLRVDAEQCTTTVELELAPKPGPTP